MSYTKEEVELGAWTCSWKKQLGVSSVVRKENSNTTRLSGLQDAVSNNWSLECISHVSSGTKTITAIGQARMLGLRPAERPPSSSEPVCFIS